MFFYVRSHSNLLRIYKQKFIILIIIQTVESYLYIKVTYKCLPNNINNINCVKYYLKLISKLNLYEMYTYVYLVF